MTQRLTEILARKRDGKALTAGEIESFVRGVSHDHVSDAQIAAFAMAVVINGMQAEETVALTRSMARSGERLSWTGLDGPVLDKHSTGGVGDKVSLILAPVLAACGAFVPMISGRGLGHTGGTLDKLESLEGYRVDVGEEELRRCLVDAGCAIVGANDRLAPADRRIYAVRDQTATVESLPLITASILSKKLAAGPDALMMDVKIGSGAFCPTIGEAEALAQSIVSVGNGVGLPTRAIISDMNQCLGRSAGNGLEVGEALDILKDVNNGDKRLKQLVAVLAAEALTMGEIASNTADAMLLVDRALSSGKAFERFERMVSVLGAKSLEPGGEAPHIQDIPASRAGVVEAIDAKAIGLAVIDLGGGRRRAGDVIDHRVGFSELIAIGERTDRPLGRVHARSDTDAEKAIRAIQNAYSVGEGRDEPPTLIHRWIRA